MLASQLTGWFSPLLLFSTAVFFVLEKSLWFSWILKHQALRFRNSIFAFSRPASKNVCGFFHLRVFLYEYCLHLSNMALPVTLYSSWLLDLADNHGLYENKTKQILEESKWLLLRGCGNLVSVTMKTSCVPKPGVLLFCHLFIVCQSHVSASSVFVTWEALACCCCLACNILRELHENLKITEKEFQVGGDIIWDHLCKAC